VIPFLHCSYRPVRDHSRVILPHFYSFIRVPYYLPTIHYYSGYLFITILDAYTFLYTAFCTLPHHISTLLFHCYHHLLRCWWWDPTLFLLPTFVFYYHRYISITHYIPLPLFISSYPLKMTIHSHHFDSYHSRYHDIPFSDLPVFLPIPLIRILPLHYAHTDPDSTFYHCSIIVHSLFVDDSHSTCYTWVFPDPTHHIFDHSCCSICSFVRRVL